MLALDIETYPNWMLVLTKNRDTSSIIGASAYGEHETLDEAGINRIRALISEHVVATYNGVNFDIPILTLMLHGGTCAEVNKLSNTIIKGNKPGWMALKHLGLYPIQLQHHVDTMAICPALRISLKSAGARLHSKHIIDLPINPATHVNRQQADELTRYCRNDLDITLDLYDHMYDRIESRAKMKLEDATAKSDAQIAEYYMKKHGGIKPPVTPPHDFFKREFNLKLPPDLLFANNQMQEIYNALLTHPFHTSMTGSIINEWIGWGPKDGQFASVQYGDLKFRMGIGGLHSQEHGVYASDVYNYDVTSYYPKIILNMDFEPEDFEGDFKAIYNRLYEQRVKCKRQGDKAGSDALKIVINGAFGKFGSPWSCIYDPQLMVSVTISGQILLLHLIDKCWQEGIEIISANTDGLVVASDASAVIKEWENEHRLETEVERYVGYWGRDVNNYCCVTADGKWKGKGIFAEPGIIKTPHADIAAIAAKSYFKDGIPVDQTIDQCNTVQSFILARNAKGGCQWRGRKLGRMARWIWSTEGEEITYVSSGSKVADSTGAWPLMTLPTEIPSHLDRQKYSDLAWDIVMSIMGE